MKITPENAMAAPCGIDCSQCKAFLAKDDPELLEALAARGMKREKLPCPGCRIGNGECPALGCDCVTYQCVIGRDIDFCFECSEFPCGRLNPAADRASILPHNLKVFNLSFIKAQGLAKWRERAPEIQKKYYQGKMVIGSGPQLADQETGGKCHGE